MWLDKDAGFSVQASVAQHRRIMAVTAKISDTCWLLVSGHAPVEDSLYEDKCEFYEQLEKALSPAVRKRIPIVLGIDANGVVGSVVSESVGAVNATTESLNGTMLRSMCQAYKLKLVNTFMDGAPTWTSSAGNGRRIDFIAVSQSHFEAVTGCWVDRSIDIAPCGRDDHWVLAVRLDLTVAEEIVGNPSFGDSGVNSVYESIPFLFVILPLVRPFESYSKSCMWNPVVIPYQVTEMWRRGFECAALQCFRQKLPPRKCRRRGFLSPVSR